MSKDSSSPQMAPLVARIIGYVIDFSVIDIIFCIVLLTIIIPNNLLGTYSKDMIVRETYSQTLLARAVVTALYYLILEGVWGKTLGKVVTGTIVLKNQTFVKSFGHICLRTAVRLVPFAVFIGIFNENTLVALHDILSGTRVVQDKKTNRFFQIFMMIMFVLMAIFVRMFSVGFGRNF